MNISMKSIVSLIGCLVVNLQAAQWKAEEQRVMLDVRGEMLDGHFLADIPFGIYQRINHHRRLQELPTLALETVRHDMLANHVYLNAWVKLALQEVEGEINSDPELAEKIDDSLIVLNLRQPVKQELVRNRDKPIASSTMKFADADLMFTADIAMMTIVPPPLPVIRDDPVRRIEKLEEEIRRIRKELEEPNHDQH